MKICGLQKTTLLDFPGFVAAAIFTGGCNFRCPYCQNSLLINPSEFLPTEEILEFLKKRRNVLEGVCISGGEPTLQADLPAFLSQVKTLGYSIKLDTNGYQPDMLITLCNEGLIDYVAMDIKSSLLEYPKICRIPHMDTALIEKSVSFLMKGKIPYEFRTTVVKEFHRKSDFCQIGQWLQGCRAYYLQNYQESERVLCPGLHGYPKSELLSFTDILKTYIPNTFLRGI